MAEKEKGISNKHNSSPSTSENKKLYVIKIGGNIIDNEFKLASFLSTFAKVGGKKILIHGGGKLATKLATKLGVEQQLIDGRRITDAETLKIVTMVYAGYINKNIVAQLQAHGCNAIGLCGADGNIIQAHKRPPVYPKSLKEELPGHSNVKSATEQAEKKDNKLTSPPLGDGGIDYGFVGDVDLVNTTLLKSLLDQDVNVVLAPITHDKKGVLLNTNADTIAQEIAQAMSHLYEVHLIYSFEKAGVLLDANDDATVIPSITPTSYTDLKEKKLIFAGMIPKLDNAFTALDKGVHRVVIGKAEELENLVAGIAGTSINRAE